jgi:monoamine oxidase
VELLSEDAVGLTRRSFLERLAQTGGAAVTYDAMAALGLLHVPTRHPSLSLRGQVPGTRVVILGAGLTGLTVAYELGKLGYRCQVLEARRRAGGRCWTVRRGTRSEEVGSSDEAGFDQELYFNAGPMRIPHHHTTTLDYCRELGVPLEVFCINNDNAFVATATGALAGRRVRMREVRADLHGYVAELLSKALSQAALDVPLSAADRDCLLEYLKREGALDERATYHGTPRRGYQVAPGAGDAAGQLTEPMDLGALLQSKLGLQLQSEYVVQPTMFQVAGGTDRLAAALVTEVGDRITYGAAVREIRQTEAGVSVAFTDADGSHQASGEFCVSTLPLPLVASLEGDLAPELRAAAHAVPYAPAGKIGLQFKRRFWEQDDGIFGGISRTDQEITQIVYPSTGFLGRKGILVGYYHNGPPALAMGARPSAERLAAALQQGERLHPQYRAEYETAFSVAWHRVPWSAGGWAQYTPELRRSAYPVLLRPDRRLYLAGDHLSYLSGWMCGAFESARMVATAIHARSEDHAVRHTSYADGR